MRLRGLYNQGFMIHVALGSVRKWLHVDGWFYCTLLRSIKVDGFNARALPPLSFLLQVMFNLGFKFLYFCPPSSLAQLKFLSGLVNFRLFAYALVNLMKIFVGKAILCSCDPMGMVLLVLFLFLLFRSCLGRWVLGGRIGSGLLGGGSIFLLLLLVTHCVCLSRTFSAVITLTNQTTSTKVFE